MSDKTLTLQDFVALLAAHVNCDENIAADFIREFSSGAAHGLATDGFVNITGLGSFRIINDVDGTPTVEFAPAPALAAAVNEPFSMFEPVELADSVSDEEVTSKSASKIEDTRAEATPLQEAAPTQEAAPPPVPEKFKSKPEPQPEGPNQPPAEASSPAITPAPANNPAPVNNPSPVNNGCVPAVAPPEPASGTALPEAPLHRESPLPVLLEPESHVTVKRVGHTTLTLLLAAAAALLLGIGIGAVIGYNFCHSIWGWDDFPLDPAIHAEAPAEPAIEDSVKTEDIDETDSLTVAPDSVAEAPAASQPAVVTDTVGPGNYLSIMAKRHYGSPKFWVYIYLENKDKIRNPDNLENGMVLVIPPAEKYDIDPDDKESLARAQREATRIANAQ